MGSARGGRCADATDQSICAQLVSRVDADLFVFDAMAHGFWFAVHMPEAREAIEIMTRFFRKYLAQ